MEELSFIGGDYNLKLFTQPSIVNQQKAQNCNETLFDDEVTKALLNGINN